MIIIEKYFVEDSTATINERRRKTEMGRKKKMVKPVTTSEENKAYLFEFFGMLKEVQIASTAQKNERFNNTEVRLMSEIVYAKSKGERLISTQLADRLALTRSAISQIVAKLEGEGVVRRVPDEIDKKIAYVELTEATEEKFGKVVDSYAEFIGQVVARFGIKKMDKMLSLVREFSEAVNDTVEICGCECKK